MDDALGVRCIQSIGNFNRHREERFQLHWTIPDQVLQRSAIQEFHRDERLPFVLTDLVNGANIRMIQRRGGLRFALEALQGWTILDQIFGKKFQSYKSVEFEVLSFVNHAHPTTTQLLDDAVMRDGLADHDLPQ